MSENSKIEWTDHSFNPWIGCTKISPGCAHCYAEAQNNLRKWNPAGWGKGVPRHRTSEANWKQPMKWNRDAAKSGLRLRVFCASLADWLDDEVPIEWLADLLRLICETPNLDWQLLTKRPQNFRTRIRAAFMEAACGSMEADSMISAWEDGDPPKNVWVGTTVENQEMADERIQKLLVIPARVRFLSCEPLLESVNLWPGIGWSEKRGYGKGSGIHWVICGGESGPGARPMHPDWARSLRDQCQQAEVAFLFKQWGEWSPAIDERRPVFVGCDGEFKDSPMQRIGKKSSGRLLDGVEWNEFP